MSFIRITQKLQKEMGIKNADLVSQGKSTEAFHEWYAHVFILARKKQVIFVETQTLFSFCIENVNLKDIRERLSGLFEKGFGKALFVEGVSALIMSKVMEICRGELKFAKTESRMTIGAMNEFVKQHKFCFSYKDRAIETQDQMNRYMPMRGFPDGSKGYKFPIEVFAKVVKDQFDLDFTPRKQDFFKKIYSDRALEI
ncbi:MAG: hypothetical protein KJ915_09275 [Candidatus Omnitrophica bacterium]|nr:hypothetical protein [Candidatus Omnitrophota bacterium]